MSGRPHSQGLKYFALDVDFFKNKKIQELTEIHQSNGPIFFLQLLSYIYTAGNHLKWDRLTIRDFRKNNEWSQEQMTSMLQSVLDVGLLDKDLYNRYQVLTSDGIQERYLYSTKKREKVIYIQEYLLIDFNSYRSIPQPIYIYDVDGELIQKYVKEPDSKFTNKKTKNKQAAAAAAPAPKPVTKGLAVKEFTYRDIMDFMMITYDQRDDAFKNDYARDEYDAYILLNKKINERFEGIRKSNRQLSFPEFIQFVTESGMDINSPDLEAAFRKMAELGINQNTDIFLRLENCLQMIKTPFVKPAPNAEPIADISYFRDEPLEKEVLTFWGFNELANPDKRNLLIAFLTVMNNTGRLDSFRGQFKCYTEFKKLNGVKYKHSFENFLGKQSERFDVGKWNAENWEEKLITERQITQSKLNQNGRATKPTGHTPDSYGKV